MSTWSLATISNADALEAALQRGGLPPSAIATKKNLILQAATHLKTLVTDPQAPVHAFFVPGRIEVLGKHTDYAAGSSIVAALEQGFCLLATPRTDTTIRFKAVTYDTLETFSLDPELVPSQGHWSNYPMTVARRLARNFNSCRQGMDTVLTSDLPSAAGMSSSSALIVATYLALAAINQLDQDELYSSHIHNTLELAAYLGTNENGQNFGTLVGDKGVGTFGGSEDHTAILCSQSAALGQFAYCPTRFERRLPLPEDCIFVLGYSGVVAEKTGQAQALYNRASLLVSTLVKIWQQDTGTDEIYLGTILASAPDAGARLLDAIKHAEPTAFTTTELQIRLRHFQVENGEIIGPAGDALAAGDLETFGRLVDRSQQLTEDWLGNQVPETIALARLARQAGAYGASAFGAGFGGSVWALVPKAQANNFVQTWSTAYKKTFPKHAATALFFLSQAGPAAFALE